MGRTNCAFVAIMMSNSGITMKDRHTHRINPNLVRAHHWNLIPQAGVVDLGEHDADLVGDDPVLEMFPEIQDQGAGEASTVRGRNATLSLSPPMDQDFDVTLVSQVTTSPVRPSVCLSV